MPDLTLVTFPICKSVQHWQTTVNGYTVYYGKSNGQYQYDYHCDCKAFKFGKGRHCKHIESVRHQRCTWGEDAYSGDGERTPENNQCPNCKGEITYIQVGT